MFGVKYIWKICISKSANGDKRLSWIYVIGHGCSQAVSAQFDISMNGFTDSSEISQEKSVSKKLGLVDWEIFLEAWGPNSNG